MFVPFCILLYAAALSTADENVSGNKLSNGEAVLCTRPQHPAHGRYTMFPPGAPGSHYIFLQLNATCNEHYHLIGAASMACVMGRWSHPMPECVPLCNEEGPRGMVSCPARAERCLLPAFSAAPVSSSTPNYEDTTDTTILQTEESTTDRLVTDKCVLPAMPKHGYYESIPWAQPGDQKVFVQMNVTCDPNHVLFGPKVIACLFGIWSDEMPHCVPYCPSESEDGVVTCGAHENRCMRKESIVEIQEGCGYMSKKHSHSEETYIPWTAGLYVKYDWIFGTGSLISTRVILTSATNFKVMRPYRDYLLAVGSIESNYNELSDIYAQKSDLKEVIIHPDYTGESTKYRNNLAIVVAANEFLFNEYVRPVCLNFNPTFNEVLLQKAKRQETSMTSWDSCLWITKPTYITPNEYSNRITEMIYDLQDNIICVEAEEKCYAGDGAGLMFKTEVDGKSRYLLRGVSSEYRLFNKNVSLFTDLMPYKQFIKSALLM